jgi:hypothetical protein
VSLNSLAECITLFAIHKTSKSIWLIKGTLYNVVVLGKLTVTLPGFSLVALLQSVTPLFSLVNALKAMNLCLEKLLIVAQISGNLLDWLEGMKM